MSDDDSCWGCILLVIAYVVIKSGFLFFDEIIGLIILVIFISIPIIILYYLVKWFNNRNKSTEIQTTFSPKPLDTETKYAILEEEIKEEMDSDPVVYEEDEKPELYQLLIETQNILDGEPVEGAHLKIENNQDFSAEKITDIDGKVMFPRLEKGNYKINIKSDEFIEEDQKINLTKNDKIVIKLKQSARLLITVLDEVLKIPIEDAVVKVGDDEYNTDKNGTVCIKGLVFGDISISVKKDQYFDQSLDYSIEDIDNKPTIELKPNITLDSKYADLRHEFEELFDNTFIKLPTSIDFLLPNYYKAIFFAMVDINESISINPVYKQKYDFNTKIDQLYDSLKEIYTEIDLTMTGSDLINDFIGMSINDDAKLPPLDINYDRYNKYITSFMNDPGSFINEFGQEIETKLNAVDNEITEKLGTFNISPVASLWTVSRKFINYSSDNITQNAASMLYGKIILDATSEMFNIDEITKRLKQQGY